MKRCVLLVLALLTSGVCRAEPPYKIESPPPDTYDPFYKKMVSVGGFPVLSSENVSDYALLEAAYLIDVMLRDREDIRQALIDGNTRCAVMAYNEVTSQVPEHSDLKPNKFWDRRARGLGATRRRPVVSCGEENLLNYPGDPYHQENILIHEFAHAMHHMGLNRIDKEFQPKLSAVYKAAMEEGLWKGKYASNNDAEYWAEGVQSWFNNNRENDHDHNHVNTREELREYDPRLAELIESVFGPREWTYVRPLDREDAPHLAGFDPARSPRFAWPEGLQAWYDDYSRSQAEKKAEREKANGQP